MKWVSGDLPVQVDANGNQLVTVGGITNMNTAKPILGFAQRIGIAGSEPTLPRCTFWVPPEANGAWGYLMIRGDPTHGGTAYFRVGTLQA